MNIDKRITLKMEESYTAKKLYDYTRKIYHLSTGEMIKRFPDICQAVEDEKMNNIPVRAHRILRNIVARRLKISCPRHK